MTLSVRPLILVDMHRPEALAAELRAEMARQNITQRELAAKVELNLRTLQRYLHGQTAIRYADLIRVADALGVQVSTLVERAEGAA